jgi:hypothetical protein
MDNFGSHTVLILATVFLIMMLGWSLLLPQMAHQAVHCAYQSQKLTCTSASKG